MTSPQVLSSSKFVKKENSNLKTLSTDQPRDAHIVSFNLLKISEHCQYYLLTIYDPISRKSISKIFSLNYPDISDKQGETSSVFNRPAIKSAFNNYYSIMQKEGLFSYVDSFSNFYV